MMMMMSTSSEAEHEIEIEKKFAVNDKTAAVLKSYGFDVVQNEEFVDWYFDLAEPKFCLEDCWFRYREKKVKMMNNWGWRGAWQVKRGQKGTRENDGITTYEV
jgi:adenylate cyclase class IV